MTFNKYTNSEVEELLKSIVILIDTREQKNDHILEYLIEKNISYELMKLEHGDYSFKIPCNDDLGIYRDKYFTNIISIERKANLNELSNNFTKGRSRIENEFIRARGKLILLIENSSYEDIIQGNYSTRYNPKAFLGTLKAFENRYNLQTNFIRSAFTGNYIYHTFYYAAREFLKNGEIAS